jgi:hypothetical protein
VLYAHSLFMDRDGTHCWVGVRHLATVTGLDKSTVAEHRAAAIAAGWLIGCKRPRGGPSTDLQAALPDGVPLESPTLSGDAGLPPVDRPPLSGSNPRPVRVQPPERPAKPDAPSRPLLPFKNGRELSDLAGQTLGRKAGSTRKSTDRDLRQWLERDPRVADYSRDLDALVRMAPEELRFRGYEEAIRVFVQGPR